MFGLNSLPVRRPKEFKIWFKHPLLKPERVWVRLKPLFKTPPLNLPLNPTRKSFEFDLKPLFKEGLEDFWIRFLKRLKPLFETSLGLINPLCSDSRTCLASKGFTYYKDKKLRECFVLSSPTPTAEFLSAWRVRFQSRFVKPRARWSGKRSRERRRQCLRTLAGPRPFITRRHAPAICPCPAL